MRRFPGTPNQGKPKTHPQLHQLEACHLVHLQDGVRVVRDQVIGSLRLLLPYRKVTAVPDLFDAATRDYVTLEIT
jgi:CDP-diacylglycerol pyrophosphatase